MRCRHRNIHFSRVLCACDWMHNYCADCGERLDPCAVEDDEPVEKIKAAFEAGEKGVTKRPSRWSRPFRLLWGWSNYYRHMWGPLCWTCKTCRELGWHRDRNLWRVFRKEKADG